MKPNFLNSILRRVFHRLIFVLNRQSVACAENLQHHGEAWRKFHFLGNETHEACVFHTLGSPPEHVLTAFVAGHTGQPAMLDELVKQGYVIGSFKDLGDVAHKIVKRVQRIPTGKRECVANEAAESREASVFNEADAPIDEILEGWVKIAPYGVYPGSKPGRPQHFHEEAANAMVREFKSVSGRLGRLFRGIPIYIGHPDKDPAIYTDHRRLGKFTDLQARPDGLYGEVEWNALGEENLKEGYWVYPSPRWDAPAGRPEFKPDRLISVGLTNMPRITTSEPVTNSLEAEDLKTEDTRQETETTEIMDRKLLTEKLGLDVTATDEEIMAKLAKLMDDAATAEAKTQEAAAAATEVTAVKTEKEGVANSLTEARGKITELETALQSAREGHANSLLDSAVARGQITPADRAGWIPRLTGEHRESEANALLDLKPILNTKAIDVVKSRVEIGDEKGRRETIANAVDAIMKEKGVGYDDAWLLAKKEPTLQPVWEAMRSEG